MDGNEGKLVMHQNLNEHDSNTVWLLETDRLQIREVDASIERQVSESVHDGDDMTDFLKAIPTEQMQDAIADSDDVLAFVKSLIASRMASDIIRYGAWDRVGELVAYIGVFDFSSGAPELQISVIQEHPGKGYATEFLMALVPYLFQQFDIDRVVYRLRANNVASEKIVLKLGGILQKPCSKVEELTVKTYHIVR